MSASPVYPVPAPVDLKTGVAPRVLNLAEAAAFVRCSRAHLCNVVHHKVPGVPHLPSVRIGRRVLFRRESLEQWLEQVEASGPKRAASLMDAAPNNLRMIMFGRDAQPFWIDMWWLFFLIRHRH